MVIRACFLMPAMVLLAVLVSGADVARAQESSEASVPEAKGEQEAGRNEKLASYLSGTRWTGQFTMSGGEGTREEYYEILSAKKAESGDQWNLVARIKYGGKDLTLPLPPIEIKFAGQTPVITIDRLLFPGFGSFDARVVIRNGKYAGTWAHVGQEREVGGHLFGKIEKMSDEELKQRLEEAGR